jgi:hypothetical protein
MRRSRLLAVLGAVALIGVETVAEANQPPGPQLLLAEVSLLPLMILLSLAGGAYAILRALRPKARRWRVLRAASAVLAILVSGASGGIAFGVAVIFGVFALQRGVQMIGWGLRARASGERPIHLFTASPARLLTAGAALLMLTVFLLGLTVAFVGYWPRPDGPRQQALREFVAYQIAAAREAQARTGRAVFRPLEQNRSAGPTCPARLPAQATIEYAPDGSEFTVLMFPGTRFPLFPYNLLTTQPSTRADQSGKIRMAAVHDQHTACPPDAPVVAVVGEAEIARMQGLLAGMEGCR